MYLQHKPKHIYVIKTMHIGMDDFCIPVTLMSGGRVTIPQEIRDALKVKDGDRIDIKIPRKEKEESPLARA